MAVITSVAGRLDVPPGLLGGYARAERDDLGRWWIVVPAGRGREQSVAPASRLVFELEAVRHHTDAEEFVRRYGLLFHGPESANTEVRESFDDWQREIARLKFTGTLVLLAQRSEAGDDKATLRLRDLLRPTSGSMDAADVRRLASGVVQVQLNERLADLRWEVRADALEHGGTGRPNVFWFAAKPDAPGAVPYAYWQLADLLVARAPLAECEGCGRFFARGDPRQRFHDDACRQRAAHRRRRELRQEGNDE